MEKAGIRTRDIQFFSGKNQKMLCVHSRWARDFAKYLEKQSWMTSYETCVPLQMDKLPNVNPVDIRKDYFSTAWTTDFVIQTVDGQVSVREFTNAANFNKRAVIEKLELSRRYWSIMDIKDWKLVISAELVNYQTGEAL